MAVAKKVKEIFITTQNKVGMLAEISSVISTAGVNIAAICAYGEGDKANFMILTSDNLKAAGALKVKGHEVKDNEIVEVQLENKVGALEEMAKKLTEADIDINYVYGTVNKAGVPATLVFSSNNDDKAIEVLK